MVRLDDEGRFVRRPVAWDEVPEAARPRIQRFVDEHLLVSDTVDGERRIEVAHEALFRAWNRLAAWLHQERELLLFRQRLGRARDEWTRLNEDPSALLDGPALAEAERWAAECGDDLDEPQIAFVEQSVRRRDRERAAVRRRRRWVVGGLAAGLAVALALAMLAARQWLRAEDQRRIAEARQLAAVAESEEPLRALLLATESLRAGWTYEGYAVWANWGSTFLPGPAHRLEVDGRVTALAAHPTELWIAFADERGIVRVVVPDTGQEVASLPVENPPNVHELTFSPDGRWLAAGHGERIAVWSTASWEHAADLDGFGHTHDVAFSADGELLAAAQRQVFLGPVSTRTWRLPRPREREPGDFALAVAFSTDGLELAIGGESTLEVWRRSEGSAEWPEEARSSSTLLTRVCRLGHEFDGLVVCGDTAEPPARLEFVPDSASRWNLIQGPGDHSSDRRWVARPEANGFALLGVLPDDRRAWMPTGGDAKLAVFSADGRWLVTGGTSLQTWNLEETARLGATLRLGSRRTESLAFSPDGSWLAVCDPEETIRLIATDSWQQQATLDASCSEIGFTADGRLVARSASDGGAIVLEDNGTEWRAVGSIAAVPAGATLALSPDRRWARVRRPYADSLRYRELIRPSRTSIVDLDTGRVVAWRTNEEEDIEVFLEAAGQVHQGLTRERIVVRWETGEVLGEEVELGIWGDRELLERGEEWPAISFERATASPDGQWSLTDGGSRIDGALYEPGSGREIVTLVRGRTMEGTAVRSAAFSPDLGRGSEWVAFATRDGVYLWRLAPVEALIEETCARVSRNLEPDEWPLDGPPPVTCPGR
jgi:WD40 repeat protein